MYAISEVVAPISYDWVVFSQIDGQAIRDITRIPTRSGILAVSNLRWKGSFGDTLILLDNEYNLSLLYQDSHVKYVEKTVTRLSTHGQLQSPGSAPLIAIDGSRESDDCFVMHVFLRTIQLVTLCHDAAQKLSGMELKRKRTVDLDTLWKINTVFIGNADVQAMVFLAHGSILAVLYSTYDFEYKLRYYEVDPIQSTVTMVKQFESFSEPVSCIIPVNQGGLLAVSGAHLFYFPDPGCSVSISLDCEDPHLSRNQQTNVATKSLHLQNLESEHVVSHVIIDDQRILFVTQRGETMMLFFEADQIGSSMIIKNMLIIRLGKTTIPIRGGLHHINKDVFLQVSKTSQLVLFLISPQKPYINIQSQVEGTGPILDLCLDSKPIHPQVITCQGAFYNSEIRKYAQAKHALTRTKTLDLPRAALRMISVEGSNEILVVGADKTASIAYFERQSPQQSAPRSNVDYSTVLAMRAADGDELSLTEQGLMMAEQMHHDASRIQDMSHGLFLAGNTFIAIMRSGEIQISTHKKVEHRKPIPNVRAVILLDRCEVNGADYFLVLWRDGNFNIFTASLECIFDSSIDADAYSGLILAPHVLGGAWNKLYVVILTCEGEIFQTLVDLRERNASPNSTITTQASVDALQLRKDKNYVIAFNASTLLGLKLDILLNMFQVSPFNMNFGDIDDIIAEDNTIYVLRGHRQIAQYTFSLTSSVSGMDLEVIHAPLMKNKCVALPQLQYGVVACFEEINLHENQVSLELIDTTSMQILYKQDLYRGPNPIAGICPVPNKRNTFIVLPLEGSGDFHLFKVHKKSLKQISSGTLTNLSSSLQVNEAKLQSISIFNAEESIFLVSGTIVFYIQLDNDTGKLKICDEPCLTVPYMSLGHTIINNSVFVCDMVEGLLQGVHIGDETHFLPVALPYMHKFATSIDCARFHESDTHEIIMGDAFGNVLISITNGLDCEQKCAFNVGSQVNTIKRIDKDPSLQEKQDFIPICVIGTVNGAIYKISRIANGAFELNLEACQKELASTSISFNKSKLDWKLPGSGFPVPRDYYGIVDVRLFQKYLAYLILGQETDQFAQRHIQARKHKDLLSRICYCTKGL